MVEQTETPAIHAINPLAAPETAPPVLVIERSRGWSSLGLRDVLEFRELLYMLTSREIKGRYRQMAFGPTWMIIAPLIQMVIFSTLFGVIFQLPSEGVPYPIFTYTALLPWQFFANATRSSAGSLIDQQQLISKIYFPRLILPVSRILSALVDFAISLVILFGLMLVYRIAPGWRALLLPGYVLLAVMTALAVGLWLATIAVKFRDVVLVLGFIITFWQYLTPVAYSATLIPEQWQWLYNLNPMTVVVEGFRWSLLGAGRGPIWTDAAVAAMMVLLAVTGAYYFRRTERTIVDTI